ncbi:tRNA adenosine(34) deaminase TadA [Candidatus Nitronereus thalassa]|uniref:tRNA-specific adenosine deaminase n=1 Tax=Candidatus Nitronereus thalassa TaxID=3020898 RepID=A0ABU3K6P3_9BACT|nr:tRNA adenosine(34) deaminase TadA [Candidatus Nitronereus thalassa]MDT7042041.1 tRNA adenosine(34) deaminase TadA [Candidatus Nitronereus thalassa]
MTQPKDHDFMQAALEEAKKAFAFGEVPVGAVLVCEDAIVARGHNQREGQHDPTAHAELLVIQQAAETLQSWRLIGTTLYVTLEPCLMCAGAILQARIPRLVFGTFDPKAGACGSLFTVHQDSRLNHQINVTHGIEEPSCRNILKEFFQQLRQNQPLPMS